MGRLLNEIQRVMAVPMLAPASRVGIIAVLALVFLVITGRFVERIESRLRSHSGLAPSEGQKRLLALGNVFRYTASTLVIVVAVIMTSVRPGSISARSSSLRAWEASFLVSEPRTSCVISSGASSC